ncbi:glucose-1-phosphate cytidylyltransferase [Bacteroidales bacterium OttesenSCG-928-B11]|nr:glucose-1-phosphate cytidylyltransferase [Bacteroidales bacterium OttesenSCG-928-E04]MDL2312552.1 glucose-1-phosphate cytidylyltransferase [Bacteroidales bacterium OttesenSCG-928-B11]
MKVVILAGGYGSRITEESHLKPKPMIEIGEKPMLWHIMKIYSHYGFNEFIICAGYKQYVIKEWFADYYLHNSDVTFDFSNRNEMTVHNNEAEPWKVTIVNTGLDTMTGGRLKRVQRYIGNEPFMLTYGDGVADVNIHELLKLHNEKGKTATISIVNVSQRFGIIDIDQNNMIHSFREKSMEDSSVINGGFMVLNPQVFDLLEDDTTVFEQYPLRRLAETGELIGYHHTGFWQCMDTQRDKMLLEDLWKSGNAPWKIW